MVWGWGVDEGIRGPGGREAFVEEGTWQTFETTLEPHLAVSARRILFQC